MTKSSTQNPPVTSAGSKQGAPRSRLQKFTPAPAPAGVALDLRSIAYIEAEHILESLRIMREEITSSLPAVVAAHPTRAEHICSQIQRESQLLNDFLLRLSVAVTIQTRTNR